MTVASDVIINIFFLSYKHDSFSQYLYEKGIKQKTTAFPVLDELKPAIEHFNYSQSEIAKAFRRGCSGAGDRAYEPTNESEGKSVPTAPSTSWALEEKQ